MKISAKILSAIGFQARMRTIVVSGICLAWCASAPAAEIARVAAKPGPTVAPPVAAVAVEPPISDKARLDPHRFDPPRERTCFGQAETREKIAQHRLTEPFRALRAGRLQGEALRAKLCRWKADEFVYEVSVLRRDGRIAHVYMNAQNGQPVGVQNEPAN